MLSSVWGTLKCHSCTGYEAIFSVASRLSQAAAMGYRCVGYVKVVVYFMAGQHFKYLKKKKVVF